MSSYLRVNLIISFMKGISYQLYLYLDDQLKVLSGGLKAYLESRILVSLIDK